MRVLTPNSIRVRGREPLLSTMLGTISEIPGDLHLEIPDKPKIVEVLCHVCGSTPRPTFKHRRWGTRLTDGIAGQRFPGEPHGSGFPHAGSRSSGPPCR